MNSSWLKRASLTATAALLAAGLTACGKPVEKMMAEDVSPAVTASAPTASTADIIAQAQARYEEAAGLSHAWTTTRTLIEQASAALQAGQTDAARALAQRALATANASVEQAKIEETAWQSRVPQ